VQISKILPYQISTKFGIHLDLPDTGASLDGCQKWTHSHRTSARLGRWSE